ncbi:MAG: amidohydrolase family protein [Paracoccus sp. (in: a-proteobacteria)]|nr:amidohydrolase family protein [Paracoccus sp. (in: a-proteobacteria)]
MIDAPPIDAHCHFWRLDRGDYGWLDGQGGPLAPIRRDFAPADYPGAGGLIAVQAAPTLAETEYLLALEDARILGVVGWVDLADDGAADQLHRLAANPRLRAIRPMLQDIADSDWLISAPQARALAALCDLGLCFDALVTARHLPALARFAAANPGLRIVIDHAAKPQSPDDPEWLAGMAALARLPGVHCKLSGLMTELSEPADIARVFAHLLEWFGPDRLIWGSDWPVVTLAAPFSAWQGLTDDLLAGLTPGARGAILGGNAARFYGVGP